ncbi:hypothetical protein GCM10011322_43450 [Salinarimonas ramus]|uniref:Type I phosphodiesterase / nucleotide pyrophosphatase n=1 Tax=Salinarimonas ramus TaxID=690164 RepID=A0A917QI53_9HYPH|nr:hypothetical protein GCM10011322_43450 [Salinarimonas ramus]
MERVVVVVFDGLRPDMVAGRMPRLEAFAGEGVRFPGARSVFPSLTRVATSSVSTGVMPGSHGIVSNAFHQPAILTGAALDTSSLTDLMRARVAWGGTVQTARSLGERLGPAGMRMAAVHCGSAGGGFMLNAAAADHGHWTFSAHGEAGTLTPDAVRRAVAAFGPLPEAEVPKFAAVEYARRVAIDQALAPDGPDVVVVWFPEPDTSFHYCGLGAPETAAVMGAVDRAFGDIVDAARAGPKGARTAVVAMSDHGQISTTGLFEIEARMRAAGLASAVRPQPGDAVALTLGASGEARLLAEDRALAADVARWLMEQDEIGMVFAREDRLADAPGALPLSAVGLAHPRAADFVYVMRSDDGPDRYGLPGRGLLTGGVPVGGGMHGGLNRHELAILLAIATPGGPSGIVDDRPCGLIDVAPTILSLLGAPPDDMEGAPLPCDGSGCKAASAEVLDARSGGFAQRLIRRRLDDRFYLEAGGRTAVGGSVAEHSGSDPASSMLC